MSLDQNRCVLCICFFPGALHEANLSDLVNKSMFNIPGLDSGSYWLMIDQLVLPFQSSCREKDSLPPEGLSLRKLIDTTNIILMFKLSIIIIY